MINQYCLEVGEPEIDVYGHVGYDAHLRWFKEGHRRLLGSLGFGFEDLEARHGVRTMVRRAEVDYMGQLHKGDIVDIKTDIERIGKTSLTYRNSIEKSGKEVSKAKITVVFVGKTGRSVEIPQDFKEELQTCFASDVFIQERYDDFGAPFEGEQQR